MAVTAAGATARFVSPAGVPVPAAPPRRSPGGEGPPDLRHKRPAHPDGERIRKAAGSATTWFLGAEAELRLDPVNPAGLLTSFLHPDVRREGGLTSWAVKDHLASNRLVAFMAAGPATTRHDLPGAGPAAPQLPRLRRAAKVHRTFVTSARLTPSASP